jgi:hypothetical protein
MKMYLFHDGLEFSRFLRNQRISRCWTQARLGRALSPARSKNLISDLERGKIIQLNAWEIIDLALVLNVPPNILLDKYLKQYGEVTLSVSPYSPVNRENRIAALAQKLARLIIDP